MQEVTSKTVEIKTNDDHLDKFYLVHDGKQVIGFGSEGRRAAVPADKTMLVGTESELKAEIEKLKLTPEVTPFDRSRARREAFLERQSQQKEDIVK